MSRTITIAKDQVTIGDDGNVTWNLPDDAGVVTEDELKANYVPKATHERLQTGVEGRITTAVDNAKKEFETGAIKDDAFLGRAIRERKDFFAEKFPKAGEGPDPETLLESFRQEHVVPLETKLAERAEEARGLKTKAVEGSIDRALVALPPTKEAAPLVRDHLTLRTKWSDEHGQTVVIDPSKAPDDPEHIQMRLVGANRVPITPEDYVKSQAGDGGVLESFFDSTVLDGSGFDGGKGPGTKESVGEQIARLEAEGKISEAAVLKEQQISGMQTG